MNFFNLRVSSFDKGGGYSVDKHCHNCFFFMAMAIGDNGIRIKNGLVFSPVLIQITTGKRITQS